MSAREHSPDPTAQPVRPEERKPFQTLLATAPPRERGGMAARLASIAFHVAIAFVLVIVTKGVKEAAEEDEPTEVTFIRIEPVEEPPPPPPPPPQQVMQAVQPPKGFQTLTTPVEIPTDIPPPDTIATSEIDFSGRGVEGGVATGVVGAPPVQDTQTYMMSQVSVIPKMTRKVIPDYPALLRRQEIEGRVILQAVVLASGELDPSSVRVVKPLHPQLDEAAKNALLRSGFSPGFYGGRPVRVLMQIPYDFTFE